MKKRVLALASALMALTLMLAACSGGDAGSSASASTPASGSASTSSSTGGDSSGAQELVFALHNEYDNIDPSITNNSFASPFLANLFEGLVTYDTTDGSLIGGNAEDWTISDDGLVYTFNLRSGLKWSDGSPLTAEDYVYTFQRILTPATTANYVAMITDYVQNAQEYYDGTATAEELGVKALDENTLEITLKNPTPFYLSILTMYTFSPVQKAAVEADPERWTLSADSYVSNGPFMLEEIKMGESVTLVKNPNYYDADKVSLEKITFRFITDIATALSAYEKDEIDGSQSVPTTDFARLKADGAGVVQVPAYGTQFYSINCERAPFDNVLVRKAIALAIDRDALINDVTQGPGTPAASAIAPGYAVDGVDFGDGRETYEIQNNANVEGARAALAEAGYPGGEGFPTLTISYWTNDTTKKVAEAIAEMLTTNLEINVELHNEEWATLKSSKLDTGDFDLAATGWSGDFLHPMTFLPLQVTGNSNNYSRYSNAEYDRLVAEAQVETDAMKAMELMRQADAVASSEYCVIPLYYRENTMLMKDYVQGYYLNPSNTLYLKTCTVTK